MTNRPDRLSVWVSERSIKFVAIAVAVVAGSLALVMALAVAPDAAHQVDLPALTDECDAAVDAAAAEARMRAQTRTLDTTTFLTDLTEKLSACSGQEARAHLDLARAAVADMATSAGIDDPRGAYAYAICALAASGYPAGLPDNDLAKSCAARSRASASGG